jgi:hypothetical protein
MFINKRYAVILDAACTTARFVRRGVRGAYLQTIKSLQIRIISYIENVANDWVGVSILEV